MNFLIQRIYSKLDLVDEIASDTIPLPPTKVTNHIKLLSKDDVANLSEHRSNDRITKLMKFFGIPAQAMNDMENMTQIANDNLSNYRKRFSNNL